MENKIVILTLENRDELIEIFRPYNKRNYNFDCYGNGYGIFIGEVIMCEYFNDYNEISIGELKSIIRNNKIKLLLNS